MKIKILLILIIIYTIHPGMAIFEPGSVENVEYHQFVITEVKPIDFYPSEIKTINITLKNIFEYPAYSVSTVIDSEKAKPIKFTHELQKYVSDEISGKQSFSVNYEIYISDNVTKGTYYIPLSVLWSSNKNGVIKRQEKLFIGIKVAENPEIINIETSNITTFPQHINPGDNFKLKITLNNIGNSKLNQIRASLDIETPFSSMGSSSEQYISSLDPKESKNIIFDLFVDKQAKSRIYNFNFTLQYKDNTNTIRIQRTSFGINIEESSEVYIQDITIDPTTLGPGVDGILLIQISNAGTNEVKNLRVTISGGDGILTQSQNFIGIIKPGTSNSETTSFGIHIDPKIKPGDYGLNIQINYDDANGIHHSKSNLYILKINEKSSIIPISSDMISDIFYGFLFVLISYGIVLIVGYNLKGSDL